MHKMNGDKTHADDNREEKIMPDVQINSLNTAVLLSPGTILSQDTNLCNFILTYFK